MGKKKRQRGQMSWEAYHANQAMAQQQAHHEQLMRQIAAAPDASGGRWAPDPYGRFHTRYWDGEAWTQWVGDADGGQHIDPV